MPSHPPPSWHPELAAGAGWGPGTAPWWPVLLTVVPPSPASVTHSHGVTHTATVLHTASVTHTATVTHTTSVTCIHSVTHTATELHT